MTSVDLTAGWVPILLEPGDAVSIPVTIPAGYDSGTWTASVYTSRRQTGTPTSFGVAGPASLVLTLTLTSAQVAALTPTGTSTFTGYWELARTVAGEPRTWLKGDFIVDAARRTASNGIQAVTVTISGGAIEVSASASSAFQPVDADLSTIAGLSPSNNDTLQYVGGAWANRTPAQAKVSLGFMGRYTATVGDGSSTSLAVTHSLGTTDVETQVRDATSGARVDCDITNTDANTVTVGPFLAAPASNSLKVVVIG
jgi:hypothetical protein